MANEITKVTDQNGVDHPFKDVAAFPRSEQIVLGAKNLMINEGKNETINGVTFTVNEDGSITANGTATAEIYYSLALRASGEPMKGLKVGEKYILSGDDAPNTEHYVFLNYFIGTTLSNGISTNNGEVKFTVPSGKEYISYGICIRNGKTVNNKVFYPMIRLASDTDSTYAPYAMTNKELTEKKVDKNVRTLSSSDNLNDVTSTGFYAATSSPINAPESQSYFQMLVLGDASIGVTRQIIYTSSGSNTAMYVRTYSGGTWKNWVKFTGTEIS